MANAGLMVQLQNITQQQQTLQQQTQAMQMLHTMMSQGGAISPPPMLETNGGGVGVTHPLQQFLIGHQQQHSPKTMSTASSSTSHAGSRTGSPRESGHQTNGHMVTSEGKYLLSRETLPAPRSRRSSIGSSTRSQQRRGHSLDRYDGFGAPNPPNESVLENAIKNEEASRELARSRKLLLGLYIHVHLIMRKTSIYLQGLS